MELNGEVLVHADRQLVWRALNDPEVLRRCIPGCEEVQQDSPTETHVRVRLKLGPVRARFVGKIVMSEVRPDEGCVMHFEGSGGPAGFAKGSSTVRLQTDQGNPSATRLSYTAQAAIGGKLGQIGGRMIDASAKQMADQFFQAFSRQLEGPAEALETAVQAPPASTASAPAAAESRTPIAAPPPGPATAAIGGESVRMLWFGLGVAATTLGFCIAAALLR